MVPLRGIPPPSGRRRCERQTALRCHQDERRLCLEKTRKGLQRLGNGVSDALSKVPK